MTKNKKSGDIAMRKSLLNTKESLARSVRKYRKFILSSFTVAVVYALLGFLLAPRLITKTAVESVSDNLDARLVLGSVAVNPFVLSLRIEGLELNNPTGDAFSRIGEIFVNFQLSSLVRWAWTFDEFHVSGAEFYLTRDAAGTLNLADLLAKKGAPIDDEQVPESAESSPIRLLVFDFSIKESVVHWNDHLPLEPVVTRIGPINIDIQELNTLPQRSGQQAVIITTDTQGTLSWSGTLQLNPINSVGRASIKGSYFPLASAYLRHQLGFNIVEGTADVELDYSVSTEVDGSIKAAVDNFELTFRNILARTFSPQTDAVSPDRDVLLLPVMSLSGGALRWPEQTVSITSLAIDDAALSLFRDRSGQLNVVAKQDANAFESAVDVDDAASAADSESAWKVSLDNFTVNRMTLGLEDQSVIPFADVGLESLDLNVSGISNEPGGSFSTSLTLVPRTGGTVALNGTISVLPDPLVELELIIDTLELAGAHPYLKPLADLNLDSGALNLNGLLQSSTENPFSLSGDLSIVEFLVTESDEGSRLGSWSRFDARNFALNSAAQSLDISEIEMLQPYANILIAEDGSINLGRIEKADNGEAVDEEPVADVAVTESTNSEFSVTVGRVVITEGAADFVDLSLPLPFEAKIANLSGDMSTIATASSEPSTVALEGTVDEFGFVRISGTVTPFDASRNTDLKVAFQNVEMPKFSAYTIPFAGREISSGKLDFDLGYKVTASELVGENKIILRDLELGEKVPHPGAMSLPLGLAVALLKDSEGKIDIDLPVRGNVDDPDFRYGGVVVKALANLIIKLVASPFALLGNLLGVEASELEYITFLHGRADLTPPEIEKSQKLAEALSLRPELVLELRGAVDREADGLALKTERFDAIIGERIAAMASDDADPAMYAQYQKDVIEKLFVETIGAADPAAALDETRIRFTTNALEGADAAEEQFDVLAYTSELRSQLIEGLPLDETELLTLANARAAKTRTAILQSDAELDGRILLGSPQAGSDGSDDAVRMKVILRAGKNNEISEDTKPAENLR